MVITFLKLILQYHTLLAPQATLKIHYDDKKLIIVNSIYEKWYTKNQQVLTDLLSS
jgi:hypothetical protein